ncbi:kinase-like domain-containing protein [Baffinella frigidus]|nr:kinase-like domain-containing protein [Cryptophyta sp. CCMP2293]
MRELDILCRLLHPYVVRTYGACTDDVTMLILVMEFAEDGTLHDFLKKNHSTLTMQDRMRLVPQLAAGMAYLHSRKVAHRDLKSLNILMHKGTCKICDFGLSKEEDGSTVSVSVLGTPAWLAPEVLKGLPLADGAAMMADVYSFAIIVWCRPKHRNHQQPENETASNFRQLVSGVGAARIRCVGPYGRTSLGTWGCAVMCIAWDATRLWKGCFDGSFRGLV